LMVPPFVQGDENVCVGPAATERDAAVGAVAPTDANAFETSVKIAIATCWASAGVSALAFGPVELSPPHATGAAAAQRRTPRMKARFCRMCSLGTVGIWGCLILQCAQTPTGTSLGPTLPT